MLDSADQCKQVKKKIMDTPSTIYKDHANKSNDPDNVWHCFLQEVPPVGVGQSAKCRTCSKIFGSCGSAKGLLTHLKTLHNIDSMKKRTEADAESKSSASASGQSSSSSLTVTPAASAANLAKKTKLTHSFQTKKDML